MKGRLTFGTRARNPGLRQLSMAWPKSRKAPVATTAATWVTKGWSSRLQALKALLMSMPAGPGGAGCGGKTGGSGRRGCSRTGGRRWPGGSTPPAGRSGVWGTFAPAWSQPSGQEFLRRYLARGGLWDVGRGVRTSTWRVGDSPRRPGQREGGDGGPQRGRRTFVEVRTWVSGTDVGTCAVGHPRTGDWPSGRGVSSRHQRLRLNLGSDPKSGDCDGDTRCGRQLIVGRAGRPTGPRPAAGNLNRAAGVRIRIAVTSAPKPSHG